MASITASFVTHFLSDTDCYATSYTQEAIASAMPLFSTFRPLSLLSFSPATYIISLHIIYYYIGWHTERFRVAAICVFRLFEIFSISPAQCRSLFLRHYHMALRFRRFYETFKCHQHKSIISLIATLFCRWALPQYYIEYSYSHSSHRH